MSPSSEGCWRCNRTSYCLRAPLLQCSNKEFYLISGQRSRFHLLATQAALVFTWPARRSGDRLAIAIVERVTATILADIHGMSDPAPVDARMYLE